MLSNLGVDDGALDERVRGKVKEFNGAEEFLTKRKERKLGENIRVEHSLVVGECWFEELGNLATDDGRGGFEISALH